MPRREGRGALLGLLLGALAVVAGGGYWAAGLRRSHDPVDLAYSQGPQDFRAWLSRTWRAGGDGRDVAEAVSRRLLSMPIAARRHTIAAMADDAFWSGVAAGEANRRFGVPLSEAVPSSEPQAARTGAATPVRAAPRSTTRRLISRRWSAMTSSGSLRQC